MLLHSLRLVASGLHSINLRNGGTAAPLHSHSFVARHCILTLSEQYPIPAICGDCDGLFVVGLGVIGDCVGDGVTTTGAGVTGDTSHVRDD